MQNSILLGWRVWKYEKGRLVSPLKYAVWKNGELEAKAWDISKALRGVAGIHASKLPKKDWKTVSRLPREWPNGWNCYGTVQALGEVVRGRTGWRAQKARIVEIAACEVIAEKIEKHFPHILVHPLPENYPGKYRIVYRTRGVRQGITIKRFCLMEDARAFADAEIEKVGLGDVLIIYVDCPSMPLDARYYVKDLDGKTYQSRARTYKSGTFKYSDKWMEVVSVIKRANGAMNGHRKDS